MSARPRCRLRARCFTRQRKRFVAFYNILLFFLNLISLSAKQLLLRYVKHARSILPLRFSVFRMHTLSVIPVYTNLHTHGLLFLLLCRHRYAPRGTQAWSQHSFIECEFTFLNHTMASKFFTVLTMTMRISHLSPRFNEKCVTGV